MTEQDFKTLTSLGGISGIIAFIALSAGICGFLVVRSNLNYLGIDAIVDVSIDDYLQAGGRYFLILLYLSLLCVFIQYLGLKRVEKKVSANEKMHRYKYWLLLPISILCLVLILSSINNRDNNIIFNSNAIWVSMDDLNLFSARLQFFVQVFLLTFFFMLINKYYSDVPGEDKNVMRFFGLFWILLFTLLPIGYGKNVYYKEYLLVNDDVVFTDSLEKIVPRNNLLLLQAKPSDLILFQYSERKIYQIPRSAILQLSFSGERKVVVDAK